MWRDELVEIGCVAGGTPDPADAAAEVLSVLRRIVPYAAACVSRYDPLTGQHSTLANSGYPERVLHHLDTWFVDNDQGYQVMRGTDTRPLRWRDVAAFEYHDSYSAQEVFIPAGFAEGVTTCLYTRSGRYTGSLHISVDDQREPADEVMPALVVLQTMLAGVADGMRSVADPLATLRESDNVAIVAMDGRILPIPGREPGEHLAPGGALSLIDPVRIPPRFWWDAPDGSWHRVRVYPVAGGAAVVESPEQLPLELTARELDVLTLMVSGHTNPQIAAELVVAPKTAAKHVEHVLAKLGCASRTEAAVMAIREGLIRWPSPARGPLHAVAA
ncbi:helix-turn-helix transcriptional regulator [Longispora albida]|uniref:helix-turn-helix transcriptional regulator n=1 Tax=Longispora albida TaxID=203523 RepID=UPI000377B478|nr:LuxR C-terminal-related transcriptional regulator [Longispora albida]